MLGSGLVKLSWPTERDEQRLIRPIPSTRHVRRNTYLLGGLAVLAGVVMLVVAISGLTSDGDDSTTANDANAPERPLSPGSPAPRRPVTGATRSRQATDAQGEEIRRNLARRRPVRAPDFSAELIHAGTLPQSLQEPFERAAAKDSLDLSELRGTPVVLHLWSSQCAPCRADARLVEATWKRWGPRGVLFVGASVNESAGAASAGDPPIRPHLSGDLRSRRRDRERSTASPPCRRRSSSPPRATSSGRSPGSPSVRQLELGAHRRESGRAFGAEQGSSREPLP